MLYHFSELFEPEAYKVLILRTHKTGRSFSDVCCEKFALYTALLLFGTLASIELSILSQDRFLWTRVTSDNTLISCTMLDLAFIQYFIQISSNIFSVFSLKIVVDSHSVVVVLESCKI